MNKKENKDKFFLLNIRITKEMHNILSDISKEQDRSMAYLVRKAIINKYVLPSQK